MSSILDNFKHPVQITYSTAWIQITDFKEIKDLSNPNDDPYLMDSIALACNLVNKYCDRIWNYQELDEKFYIFTEKKLITYLKAIPVESIVYYYLRDKKGNEIQMNQNTILLDPIDGMIEIGGLKGLAIIRYKGGFQNNKIPLEVKKATALLAKYLFNLHKKEGIKSFSTQTYSQVFDDQNKEMEEIKSLLNLYRRVTPAIV